jgi:hypothetical protein
MPSTRHGNGLSRPALDRSKQREFFGSANGMVDYRVLSNVSMQTLGQPIGSGSLVFSVRKPLGIYVQMEKIIPAPSIDHSAPPRGTELPAAPSGVPVRPASEDAGQRSRAIIPGDDPGDQQPPKSIQAAAPARLGCSCTSGNRADQTYSRSRVVM